LAPDLHPRANGDPWIPAYAGMRGGGADNLSLDTPPARSMTGWGMVLLRDLRVLKNFNHRAQRKAQRKIKKTWRLGALAVYF